MDIVFIRHGEAEAQRPDRPDMARELVEDGRSRTSEAALFLKKRLNPKHRVHIFSSPAARALQTAQLVAKELGMKRPLAQLEGIYTGERDALFRELAALPEDSCALVVGHQPYLGEFCQALGGEHIHFRKSGMAGFTRTQTHPLQAARTWLYLAE